MGPPNTKVGHITGQVDIETQRNTVDISVKACCLFKISLSGKNQHCIVSIQQNLLETNSKAYVIYVFLVIFGHLLRLGEAKLNNGGDHIHNSSTHDASPSGVRRSLKKVEMRPMGINLTPLACLL